MEFPEEVIEINVDGANIQKASIDADVNRVIIASTSSVYGKPQSLPYTENHPTKPISLYGVSMLT